MRVGALLMRQPPRKPQTEPIPFQELLPLKLKNRVSSKQTMSSKVACIEEMAVMLACLKANEYNQNVCSKEISGFQSCYLNSQAEKLQKEEQDKKGVMVAGDKKLGFKGINQMLKNFPAQT